MPNTVRDVNISGVETGAGVQIVRKWMAHLVDVTFGGATASWYRFGRDLEEYNVDLNPNTETRRNIIGNNTFIHNGYEPSGESDTFYAHVGDPLFDKLQNIVDTMATGDACKTSSLEVHTWEEVSTNVFRATKQDCYVVPTSYGGDTSGYQIPYQITYVGEKTVGTYNASTKVFTAGTANSVQLSALTIGTLALIPPFSPSTTFYNATTNNASDTVTATAEDSDATIAITNGSTSVTNGGSATWSDGANALVITVTNSGESKNYNVIVSKPS